MGELNQGSNPHIRAIVWIRGETFKAESETADVRQPKWNENQTVLAAAIHSLDRDIDTLEGAAAGSWSLGIVEQSQGEGCSWLWRDGLRGCEGNACGGKARRPWKQGDTAESCTAGGANTIACLSQHASIGSWTIESLAHQMLDALNYRVGPHPECPFKCLMCQPNYRVGPQPGGPLFVPDMPNNREGP